MFLDKKDLPPLTINPSPGPLTIFGLVICAWLIANLASAQSVVDQSQLNAGDQRRAIHSNASLAQSFVVGADGFFAGVELSLGGPNSTIPLRAKVIGRDGTVLGDVALGEDHLTRDELGAEPDALDAETVTATNIDFTRFAIPVNVGDELAILLESNVPSTNSFSAGLALDNDAYADGQIFSGGSPSTGDLAFKTFVTQLELAEIVDQHQLNGFDQSRLLNPGVAFGQTLTVGATGLLEGIELLVEGTGAGAPMLVEILNVDQGLVDATVLGALDVAPSPQVAGGSALHRNEVGELYLDLKSLQIVVVAGDQIAIRLSTTNAGPGNWTFRRSLSNAYGGGASFTDLTFNVNIDMAFKTFVSDPIFADGFETGDVSRWVLVQ